MPRIHAPALRYIAFLRAINVGGHVVRMADLRASFESLRLGSVETIIASGNVAFESARTDAAELEAMIEAHLEKTLGYAVATFVRTPAEVAAAAAVAFAAPDPGVKALSVGFVRSPLGADAASRVLALATDLDDFHVAGREVYWRCRVRISDSKVSGARLERALGGASTFRNITTVRKIAAKYHG
jgi:uncharacterized protein (DUF1697 family)